MGREREKGERKTDRDAAGKKGGGGGVLLIKC